MFVRARHMAQQAMLRCQQVVSVVHHWIMEIDVDDEERRRH